MSPLRDQLRAARTGYESVSYPGDLAAEVLPAPRERRTARWVRWTLLTGGFGAGSLAAAAAIVLALVNFLPHTTHAQPDADSAVAQGLSSLSLSDLPAQLSKLTSVVPVEKVRSTLHLLGVPFIGGDADDRAPAKPKPDPAAA